uniref:ATP-binding cassette domain-containing protein n=1 Tax=Candidatus Phytoplasma australasiaticum subsp. australasiaticum TaxID=2832407 RepID=A0A7S7FZX0_9MOLU|nr:ATP-binding cassette domain-containing protein ['Parthenium hysterophorus' phyllody phytoplasma]
MEKDCISALKGVNISLSSEGLVFIIGKSGSGKTTLMNILGGLEKISDGDVIFKINLFEILMKAISIIIEINQLDLFFNILI